MKKIINNNTAAVGKAGIGLVVILVFIAILAILIGSYYIVDKPNPYIPDPPEPIDPDNPSVGSFGQELILTYKDGSNQSVKNFDDNLFAVLYKDKEVEDFTWRLSAKASGENQDSTKIYYSDYVLKTELTQSGNTNVIHTYSIPFDGTTSIDVDDQWHTVVESTKGIDNIIPDTMMGYPYLAEGKYTVTFKSDGTLKYYDSGTFKNADNPVEISIEFEVKHDSSGDLIVTFKGEAGVTYK